LQCHPRLGIHAANVAPEFGVAETRALVSVLENNGLSKLADQFLQLAFESNKWDKWMLKNTKATDRDRAIIAGHYVFSKPECGDIKGAAAQELSRKGIELEAYLKQAVKMSVFRYLKNFRLVKPT